jgi:5,10-methenyltetrahydrofolate synthetase
LTRGPSLDNESSRKLQRAQLLAARSSPEHAARESALQQRVADWLARADVRSVGFYFPIRGEPDLRDVIAAWLDADTRRVAALPVVSGNTLEFRSWTRDAPLRAAEFGIPVPAHGRIVQPDCLLIPCVGFDAARHRLGYGGGYYDRTLASLVPWPLVVGIAYETSKLETIDPQPHDMRLDAVITDVAQY